MKEYKFGDMVMVGLSKGIIFKVEKKKKWTYYEVLFEGAQEIGNDWDDVGRVTEIIREDKL